MVMVHQHIDLYTSQRHTLLWRRMLCQIWATTPGNTVKDRPSIVNMAHRPHNMEANNSIRLHGILDIKLVLVDSGEAFDWNNSFVLSYVFSHSLLITSTSILLRHDGHVPLYSYLQKSLHSQFIYPTCRIFVYKCLWLVFM